MIALIGLDTAGSCAWTSSLESLPQPPALHYSAFVIRCDHRLSMEALVQWFVHVRSDRPNVPIGAVMSSTDPSIISALRAGICFVPLIEEKELDHGRIPVSALEPVRYNAVEGRILDGWRTRWDLQSPENEILASVAAAVGVHGGGIKSLSRALGLPRATLYRRFSQAGLPAPGELLARARIDSVEIRRGLGLEAPAARMAAGWLSTSAHARARRRARDTHWSVT